MSDRTINQTNVNQDNNFYRSLSLMSDRERNVKTCPGATAKSTQDNVSGFYQSISKSPFRVSDRLSD